MRNRTNKIKDCFIVIGGNITKYRKQKDMTLEELGFSIGLDKSAIFHIEKGKPITVTTLLKISAVLEIHISCFFENMPELKKENLY